MMTIKGDVNWGIIGCGDVCEVKSGPAFNKVPHSKLVAVMRRNAEKAKDFARRHGVAKYYSEAEKLIADEEVNAIYIATPPAFHEEYALKAMKAGKPVYIEKPVATDAFSCQRILDCSEENKVPAVSAHYRRELPLFQKVRALLQQKVLGEIRLIDLKLLQSPAKNVIAQTEENWRINPEISGGGLFHDLAPHQLDILYWIFGNPGEVSGMSLNQGGQYNAPDMSALEALFDSKTYFRGLWSFNVPVGAVADVCTIIGEKGMLSFPFFGAPLLSVVSAAGKEEMQFTNPKHIQQPFIAQVVRHFRGEARNPCSLKEALVSLQMMDEVIK